MTVRDLSSRRDRRQADIASAIARHPAGSALETATLGHLIDAPVPTPPADLALEALCRRWDDLTATFCTGPDMLDPEQAEELLQHIAATLVHEDARIGLCLMLPQLRAAVAEHDAIRDGDVTPHDIGCSSFDQALGRARAEIDWLLCPLLFGYPSHDACPGCVRHRQTVRAWHRRGHCPDHARTV